MAEICGALLIISAVGGFTMSQDVSPLMPISAGLLFATGLLMLGLASSRRA